MWLLSKSHHSGREAQNSRGWGRPAGLACGLLSGALCSDSKPSAGLWNGGCFLMHASGQSQAYTPSTISVLLLSLFFFSFSFSCSLSHSLRVIEYLETQCKQSGRWQVRRKLSLRVIFTHFHLITRYLKIILWRHYYYISFSTSPFQLFLFYNSS